MKDITIHPGATVRQAMEAMDKTSEKILLVVDKERVLIGALSDGDIRRYILRGGDLSGTIKGAYQSEPIFVFQDDYDIERIKKLLTGNRIGLIPILDKSKKIVNFVTWETVFGNNRNLQIKRLDVPVVIMAGGKGTRLEPFTKVLPKPLVPVGNKTVVDHIIDNFRAFGIHNFYLTIHHMSKIIRAYFEERNPDYFLEFAEEEKARGTAGSLKLLENKLNTPFFVSNCDIVVETDYSDLYQFHTQGGYDITLVASAKQFNIPYGICELNGGGSLECIKEKPRYNFLVNTGLYVLNPDVIDLIPDDGLFHITQLMNEIKKNGGTIGVYPVSEQAWIDVGQWAEYRKALKVIEDI
jgi:dTDP-glucose pyrophosphorylase